MIALEQISLSYKGKVPKRKDGLQRRNEILAAALRLIAKHGVREVRHRAVAKEANVPLSATTYYFEDIQSLIHDAHVFYQENTIGEVQSMAAYAFNALEQFQNSKDLDQLKQALRDFLQTYIDQQVKNRDARMVEWSFRQQALRQPQLTNILYQPSQLMLDTIYQFFQGLSGNPEQTTHQSRAKASIFMGTLSQLEYELLIAPNSEQDTVIKHTIEQLLSSLISEN